MSNCGTELSHAQTRESLCGQRDVIRKAPELAFVDASLCMQALQLKVHGAWSSKAALLID